MTSRWLFAARSAWWCASSAHSLYRSDLLLPAIVVFVPTVLVCVGISFCPTQDASPLFTRGTGSYKPWVLRIISYAVARGWSHAQSDLLPHRKPQLQIWHFPAAHAMPCVSAPCRTKCCKHVRSDLLYVSVVDFVKNRSGCSLQAFPTPFLPPTALIAIQSKLTLSHLRQTYYYALNMLTQPSGRCAPCGRGAATTRGHTIRSLKAPNACGTSIAAARMLQEEQRGDCLTARVIYSDVTTLPGGLLWPGLRAPSVQGGQLITLMWVQMRLLGELGHNQIQELVVRCWSSGRQSSEVACCTAPPVARLVAACQRTKEVPYVG